MSGKQSKKMRKIKGLSKKAVAGAAAALLTATPLVSEGGEFLVSLYPHFSFPVLKFDDSLSTGFGGGLRLTYRPTDGFGIFLQGDYKNFSFDTKQSIGNLSVLDGSIGAGYYLPLNDRLGLNFDAGIGYYYANYQKGSGSAKSSTPLQGFNVGGSISVSYKIGPAISVYAGGGAQHYAYKNSKFITSADVNPGLTVNITRAFSNKDNVTLGEHSLKPVFPVFYSWYNDNSFGTVEVCNNEDSSVTDVTVSFYQPQYMSQPRECGRQSVLKKGESLEVDLKAFFNENMLSLNEKSDTLANIIVEYKYLGAKRSQSFPMVVPVYGRNNMSWEDDRCASAFVSSKDPAAMWFAKYVTSTVRDNIRSGVPQNIQYAMAVFQALDDFGINYVKDPTSAFEDNVGTASIDFLQFPYQTLMYRGGDCDDLSILTCSLLESIGINTAFITIPGHIFMAFDSGLTLAEAQDYFISLDNFIVDGNRVWVPLEITLSDEGFNKAWHKGSWEWNTANRTGDAMLYRMEDSWKIYKPVSVPGAAAKFTLPEEKAVAMGFANTVDEFVLNQITPQIAWFENVIAKAPTAQNYNDFGILYARYGLFEQAEKQFRLARTTKYMPAILNTANLYYSQKNYSEASHWYHQVLNADPQNNLAMLGLARCAYETGDYAECDKWYGAVYKNDRTLAKQYSYLGAFEETSGRSFSLADRLENTVWLGSANYNSKNTNGTLSADGVELSDAQANALVINSSFPAKENMQIAMTGSMLAIVPATGKKEIEDALKDDEDKTGSGAGDGKPDLFGSDDEYKGISSQLDFNILSAQDLANLAADTIEENGQTLDDFDASAFNISVREDKLVDTTAFAVLETKTTAVTENTIVVPEALEGAETTSGVPVLREPQQPLVEGPQSQTAQIEIPDINELIPTVAMLGIEEADVGDLRATATRKSTTTTTSATTTSTAASSTNTTTTASTDWVPDLIDGLKELESTSADQTSVVPENTSAVPEALEGPQSPSSSLDGQQPPKKSNKKIYIGFAALAAALTALFIGLKKKRKEK